MKHMLRIFGTLAVVGLVLCCGPSGCQKEEGPLEKAGKKADGLLKKASESAKQTVDKMKD